MTRLEIYDSQGYRFTGDGRREDRLDEAETLFKNGIKLAVQSGRQGDVFLYFKAKETETSRFEQFCARYRPQPGDPKPLRTLVETLRSTVEGEWGYTIKKDDSVYSELANYPVIASPPGSEEDRNVFRRLVAGGRNPVVGVRNATRALSLIGEVKADVSSYAIAEKEPSEEPWDVTVVIDNSHSGIQPLGDTKQAWKTEEQTYKTSSLKDAVSWFGREQGLSDSEIKRKAGLRTPPRNPDSGSDSRFDVVNVALLGIVVVGLLVLVAAGSAMLFGVPSAIPIIGDDDAIEGTVTDTTVTDTDDAAVEGAEIRLLEERADDNDIRRDNATTDENGTYTLSAPPGEYRLEVEHGDYESETRDVSIPPEDDEEEMFDFELNPLQESGTDAEDEDPASEEDSGDTATEEDSGDTATEEDSGDPEET